jgi:hypothetical protein
LFLIFSNDMNFDNPTALHIGLSGELLGKRYRVVGRMTMGMDDDGDTYFWNEFNIVDEGGEHATLVYEESEPGGEWKLFTMFEPEYPMTAEDASTRKVGDELNLEGTQARITLVDESRVYHIEGEAPEGVQTGDVAHYFNAELRDTMVVVSWTGQEVEYFLGNDLPRGVVADAFKLPTESRSNFLQIKSLDSGSPRGSTTKVIAVLLSLFIAGALLFVFFTNFTSCSARRPSPMKPAAAPNARLQVGSRGTLDGKARRVTAHTLMRIAAVGALYDRHEYHLMDDEENTALLIQDARDFTLFTPTQPSVPMTPRTAAALRYGESVEVDGLVARVTEIFQSSVLRTDGGSSANLWDAPVLFGFTARTNSALLLVRWTASGIAFHRGRVITEKSVSDAFSQQH